ncbi:hypothetical protein AB0C02_26065 [Micromonospora sp. NPDC048999]|uniref:hypothetical protein n=1 Tax=Micromonospora sp. NPDC048999 TaxID=3155391 RepID=UPI0033F80F81
MHRGALWPLALGTEYVASWTGWPVPGLGRSRIGQLTRRRTELTVARGQKIQRLEKS